MAYLERIPVGDFPAIVNMLGEKGSKKLGYNTYLEWRKGAHSKGCIGIRYNSTFVVTYYHDGKIELNSGGWKTRTTKQRIVHGLPGGWSLSQRDSVWYLSNGSVDWQFADGIIIVPDGTVVSGANRTLREIFALKKKILEYCKDYIEKLFNGHVPAPSRADCWYCFLSTREGVPVGEATGNIDHLESHFERRYYVPSLLTRAIAVIPVSRLAMSVLGTFWGGNWAERQKRQALNSGWSKGIAKEQLCKSLYRYLTRQFGFAS